MNFFKKILNSLNQMSSPLFSFDANKSELSFILPNDEKFDFTLENYEVKTRHDPYVLEAYTFNSKDIFFEYIHLDTNTSWNGLARGYFEELLKDSIKENLELEERFEFKHYEFSTYKTATKGFVHLIYIWEVNKEVFLIDKKGILYNEFIKLLKSDYEYKYSGREIFDLYHEISLVKHNSLNHYFNGSSD